MYNAVIERSNPSLFVFLIDQSGSMSGVFQQNKLNLRKDQFVADTLNKTLREISLRCTQGNEVRDYYDIAIIGYGAEVRSILPHKFDGQLILSISKIAPFPIRVEEHLKKVEDKFGRFVEENDIFPVWVEPSSSGGTPMCRAFRFANEIIANWLVHHPHAFPPIVFHLTDGESTDGSPIDVASNLRSLHTTDGNVILFNIHVSASAPFSFKFPTSVTPLPDTFAIQLLNISSPLIPSWTESFGEISNVQLTTGNYCFIYNAGPDDVVKVLEIGTRPSRKIK